MAAQKKDDGKAHTSLWERLERPAPAPRQTLTPNRIASVAVEIADAEGLDAITMRRLATELGVAPMAAYRYVSGKDDVLQLMVDLVYAELQLPDATGWRESVRALAIRTRALMLKHSWLAQLSPQALLALTPNRMAVAERSLTALDDLGLDADTMMAVVRTVEAYVYGTTHAEIALHQLMEGQGWSSGDEVRTGLAPQMIWLMDTGHYPTYRRYTFEAARKDDPQWQFEIGLDCVLDGIAVRVGI
ncbi:AcrR family transcriptional regulator [Streptosporangium album]|uniref:AcrR family transcriptional regulator n=1 Tax=Streptosporangium album TaxID=47479 RepID=A0A7W7WE15_9ACTN|nr:TetR/AcrR family transcriptional regulator [Streptosporangium album]MBB4942960.1 AcrR family transcriptional regulator [Streptosporangium album]